MPSLQVHVTETGWPSGSLALAVNVKVVNCAMPKATLLEMGGWARPWQPGRVVDLPPIGASPAPSWVTSEASPCTSVGALVSASWSTTVNV